MSVTRFLKQRAVSIQAPGTYTLPNWYDPEGRLRTFACRTTRVSPFRMLLDVPVVGKVGDRLTSYFREFGKFDGLIAIHQLHLSAPLTSLDLVDPESGRKRWSIGSHQKEDTFSL